MVIDDNWPVCTKVKGMLIHSIFEYLYLGSMWENGFVN